MTPRQSRPRSHPGQGAPSRLSDRLVRYVQRGWVRDRRPATGPGHYHDLLEVDRTVIAALDANPYDPRRDLMARAIYQLHDRNGEIPSVVAIDLDRNRARGHDTPLEAAIRYLLDPTPTALIYTEQDPTS